MWDSEEIATKKLFVPSTCTKTTPKEISRDIRLPEFKTYGSKRGTSIPHFLISISGVVVIDIPYDSTQNHDVLVRMPPSTRLTLARNAIENRPETIQYLKDVIDVTVKGSMASKEGAILLDGFCKGLKAWETMTPSIAEAQLSTYLHQSVQKLLQENDLIPYPLEQAAMLEPLLPKNKKLVPFPKELLFDHFQAFENLLDEHFRAEKRDRLIAGKSVLFTNVDKVTSLGLRNWVFAPKNLIDTNPTKKSLRLSLVTCYADEGKELELPPKKKSPSCQAPWHG